MKKIALTEKHRRLGRHFERFVERRWHKDFKLSDEALEIFIRIETHGKLSATEAERVIAAPLFSGKTNYELTLKMLYEEMANWWSNGWGWMNPIAAVFEHEWQTLPRDTVYLRSLVKIMRKCRDEGFINALSSFTGLSQEQKRKYLEVFSCNHSLQGVQGRH